MQRKSNTYVEKNKNSYWRIPRVKEAKDFIKLYFIIYMLLYLNGKMA